MKETKWALSLRPRSRSRSPYNLRLSSKGEETEDEAGIAKNWRLPDPGQLAIAGAGDPFSALPADLPRRVVTEQIENSWRCLTNMVTNRSFGDAHGPTFANHILSMASQSPALMYSMMTAAMMYTRVARRDSTNYVLELTVGAKAIESLNQELLRPTPVITDSILWAVVALGYSGSVGQLRSGKHPRQSFLRELQSLHIYGRLMVNPAHVGGLAKLMQLRGGIDKIQTPGMVQVMSFADLFESSRNLRRPYLPFFPHTRTFLDNGRLSISDSEREWTFPLSSRLGTGFWAVWQRPSEVELEELCAVIQHLCDFTLVVDNYVEGRATHTLPAELTDQRNFVQHNLMSLQSAAEWRTEGHDAIDAQYDCCRLACIAYSFLVVLPLPPMVGLFDKVALSLQKRLLAMDGIDSSFDESRTQLQLWVVTLGTIISIGLPIYSWYLDRLSALVKRLQLRSWPAMADILQTLLWHPPTNGRDGAEIWEDLRRCEGFIQEPGSWEVSARLLRSGLQA